MNMLIIQKCKSLKDENKLFLKVCNEFYEKWNGSEKEAKTLKDE